MQILFAAAHFLNAFINLFSFIRTRARKNKRENLFDDITEGFITDQKSLGNRFGIKRLFYNGCGIVALYNILSFLKVKKSLSDIIYENEKNALLHGIFGLSPYGVKKYLSSLGFETEISGGGICKNVLAEKPFIHFYIRKDLLAHYVCAIPDGDKHIYLNSVISPKPASAEDYTDAVKKRGILYECVFIVR